ncbi:MAG: hypothetical protein ACXVWU_04500 [Nocardioides sp.]
MTVQMVLDVSGWLVTAVVAGVVVVLFALAWWSSGRSKPLGRGRAEMSQTEKDYLVEGSNRRAGQFGGNGLGGLGG